MANPFRRKKKKPVHYDDEEIVPEDEEDYEEDDEEEVEEEGEPLLAPKRKKVVRPKKERYAAHYQAELLYITDEENPDRPILIRQSRKLEELYPELTIKVKNMNDHDKIMKSL
jgi:hypothetical protein